MSALLPSLRFLFIPQMEGMKGKLNVKGHISDRGRERDGKVARVPFII